MFSLFSILIHNVIEFVSAEAQQAMIHKAIKYWEKETCVRFRFVKDKDHIPGDNLVFKKGKG